MEFRSESVAGQLPSLIKIQSSLDSAILAYVSLFLYKCNVQIRATKIHALGNCLVIIKFSSPAQP